MSTPLLVMAVIAVVVILGVAAAVLLRRTKSSEARGPENNLDTAWERYIRRPGEWSKRDQQAIKRLSDVDDEALRNLKASVGETVEQALAAPNPQVALRQAIMDATDRFVMAENLYTENEAGTQATSDHLDNVVRVGVLRCASMLRFQDYSANDWYAHYLSVTEMNAKNVAEMVRTTVRGEESPLETSLHDPLAQTMRQVRESLLHHPPQTAVERADKLTKEEDVPRLRPTQKQIDGLTKTMGVRFEKLFTGQIYRIHQGPSLKPAAAFQFDAGLLYVLLSLSFRHHEDAWRQIMGEALGRHKEAMLRNEEGLLETGRGLRHVWLENAQQGPLGPVLRAACRTALETPESGSAEVEALVSGMMEDAGVLVGAIRGVVEKD